MMRRYQQLVDLIYNTYLRIRYPFISRIGWNTSIDRRVRFMPGNGGNISIGKGCEIFRYTELCSPVTIGDNVNINRSVYLRPNVVLESNIDIGPFVKLITDSHEIGSAGRRAGKSTFNGIIVRKGVWIGASAIILSGIEIGEGSIVAAGSVAINNVKPNCLYAGNPAKLKKELSV